ncbi:MAG: hypothetical protein ACRBBW_11910 [Cellvibrionaceae bacterium]
MRTPNCRMLLLLPLLLTLSLGSHADRDQSSGSCKDESLTPQRLQVLALLPLDNAEELPSHIDFNHASHTESPDKKNTAHQLQLVRSVADNASDLLINLLIDGEDPITIASIPLQRRSIKHGGFSSIGQLELVWPEANSSTTTFESRLPELYLTQTSTPAKGDRHFRPGPPITFRYRYQPSCYQRIPLDSEGS